MHIFKIDFLPTQSRWAVQSSRTETIWLTEHNVGFWSFSEERNAVMKSRTKWLSEIKIQGLLWAGLETGDCVSARCGFKNPWVSHEGRTQKFMQNSTDKWETNSELKQMSILCCTEEIRFRKWFLWSLRPTLSFTRVFLLFHFLEAL